eukprot:Skav224725  [mRNA]  locus=scaffold699:519563:522691:+ [translate_table: standard]
MAVEVDEPGEEEQVDEEVPELLELIDEVESATEEELPAVIRKIGLRLRASPKDRDLLSDFEGINQICDALSKAAWQGEAMLAFCGIMPEVCRTSLVNRACLRETGFLEATVKMLKKSFDARDELVLLAGCTAITAMCTANDANKQIAAQVFEEKALIVDGSAEEKPLHGAIFLLLDILEEFPESVQLQTEAMAALRSLVVDDDTRKSESMPSALENREVLLSEEVYPKVRGIVEKASKMDKQPLKLTEQVLLLLREIARGQERIQELAKPSTMMPYVRSALGSSEARLVRAALAVLRAFAFCEDVRDELSLWESQKCFCKGYVQAVRDHLGTPVVCEQGYGLPDVAKSVIQLLWSKLTAPYVMRVAFEVFVDSVGLTLLVNAHALIEIVTQKLCSWQTLVGWGPFYQSCLGVSRQNPKALGEVRDAEMFGEMRKMVGEHQDQQRWHGAVEVARQFLREFREDEGVQKKPVYNATWIGIQQCLQGPFAVHEDTVSTGQFAKGSTM